MQIVNSLNLPFGRVTYYNTDNVPLIIESATELMEALAARDGVTSTPPAKIFSVADLKTENVKVGLFFFDVDRTKVYPQLMSFDSSLLSFGGHVDFFKSLPGAIFNKNKSCLAYPRGLTYFDTKRQVYAIVTGDWFNEEDKEKVLTAFNVPNDMPVYVIPATQYNWTPDQYQEEGKQLSGTDAFV